MTSGVIIFSELRDGAFELLTKGREIARQLNTELSALVIGDKDDKKLRPYFEYGAQKIFLVSADGIEELDAETCANVIFEVTKENGPDIVLIRSSRLGKETAGRVAQKLQAGCITDAIGLTMRGSDLVIDRYALGGNTVSSEIIKTTKKVVSVMPRTFETQAGPVEGKIETVDIKIAPRRVQVVERRQKVGESVNIEAAETLVCVGKGITKKKGLTIINELCGALKGELGCTRALSSDYHWISEDRMVGISGKRCKPKLNVSIGTSGQIQHTVGILGSKLIVAINKDKEASIFKIADYGIVGDLYQVVPKLTQEIKGK